MKKFLLTASMLLMGVVAMFAQNVPDASKWTVGQEIEGIIQNPSFTIPADQGIVWKYSDASSPNLDGGLFESWNSGSKTTVFQYVLLPKGKYRVTCQGYYRGGGEDQDTDNFINYDSQWQDNASLFVQNGEYDSSKDVFKGGHVFKNPLMPRLFELVEDQIYFGVEGDADWAIDHSHTVGGKTVWGPGGVNGSLAWFAAGKYGPYEDDNVVYNIVDFFLTKDGYVKLGAMKTGEQSGGDTFFLTNVKLYYNGAVGADDELMVAQSDCDDLLNELHEMRDDENNGGLLAEKLGDALMIFEQIDYGSDPYEFDLETANAARDVLTALKDNATSAKNDMASLKSAINSIDALATTTDYPGKDALNKALEAAKATLSDDYTYEGEEGWDTYSKLRDDLYAARLEYMKSSPKGEDGSWDFTAFISYPWFCNPEFEPTWDAENNTWVANEAALATEWAGVDDIDSTEDGWYTDNDGNKVVITETNFLADKVPFTSDQNAVGQWYKVNTGLVLYWNDQLTCVKKWDMPHTDDGVREVAQKVVGIPNGFYKLKALGQTWMNDWDSAEKLCKCRIYLKSGEDVSESDYLEPGGWWGKDINQWKELETDFVNVTNNELIVAGHDNGFVAWTGFRLYYYGETPDYAALLKPALDEAKEGAEALSWNGDKKVAQELLAKVPTTIPDADTYKVAQEAVKAAKDYITKANSTVTAWKGIDNFSALAGKYGFDDASAEASFINTALLETLNIGEEEEGEWFYTDAIANDDQYKAYVSYLDYRESLGDYVKDALVAPVIE